MNDARRTVAQQPGCTAIALHNCTVFLLCLIKHATLWKYLEHRDEPKAADRLGIAIVCISEAVDASSPVHIKHSFLWWGTRDWIGWAYVNGEAMHVYIYHMPRTQCARISSSSCITNIEARGSLRHIRPSLSAWGICAANFWWPSLEGCIYPEYTKQPWFI